jgi:hypothetical protein
MFIERRVSSMRMPALARALAIALLLSTDAGVMAQAPGSSAQSGVAPVQARPPAPHGTSMPPAAGSADAPATRQAPVGHRQPRMQDLPPDVRKQEELLVPGTGR